MRGAEQRLTLKLIGRLDAWTVVTPISLYVLVASQDNIWSWSCVLEHPGTPDNQHTCPKLTLTLVYPDSIKLCILLHLFSSYADQRKLIQRQPTTTEVLLQLMKKLWVSSWFAASVKIWWAINARKLWWMLALDIKRIPRLFWGKGVTVQ